MKDDDPFAGYSGTESVRANLKRKSIRGAVFMASGSGSEVLIRLGSVAILARLLSQEDFGLVAMVTAVTGMLDGFKDMGLSTATVQRAEISHRQVSNLFWVNVMVGCVLALAVCLATPLVASFFADQRLIGITLALSLVFVWNGLAVQHEALMTRQMRQGELSIIRLVASLLSTAIAVWLALAGWGYWALVWREVARSAIAALGVWLLCRWLPALPSRNADTRGLIRFGGEVGFTNLLVNLIANVDRLLIGRFFGAGPVGIYRQAQQLVLVPIDQLNGPIIGVSQPALSALQQDRLRYRRFYEKIVFLVTMGVFPLGLFVAVYAHEITLLVLGPAWADAADFIRVFGVAAAVRPAIATTAIVVLTCGHSTRLMVIAVVHSAVLTLLLFVGLYWGAIGVALASLSATLALLYPKLVYSFAKTPATIRGFFSAVQTPVISGLTMVAGLVILRGVFSPDGAIESLVLGAFMAAATYLGATWAQRRGREELRTLFVDLRTALRRRVTSA